MPFRGVDMVGVDGFTLAWTRTVGLEGGYSNNKSDPGGETMYGVTARIARAFGYTGPMLDLPRATATAIGRKAFWDPLRLDQVASISQPIAEEVFDTNYNFYAGAAANFLQRALNALNRGGHDFADELVDGKIGPITLLALGAFIKTRGTGGVLVLLRCLNGLQLADYVRQVEANEAKEDFFYGWVLNRVAMDSDDAPA